jgi:hypothetical protein
MQKHPHIDPTAGLARLQPGPAIQTRLEPGEPSDEAAVKGAKLELGEPSNAELAELKKTLGMAFRGGS